MPSIIPVFIPHVGCQHDCVFCNQKKIAGCVSAPGGDDVEAIIAEALEKIGDKKPQVAFYGGSFTAIELTQMIEYLSAVKGFIDSGRVSGIRLSTRPDCIDEERLSVLRQYGADTIELGTQSMIDSVLEKSGRGHTAKDTVNAVRLIKKHNFHLILQMMTHLPGSDDEKDIATAEAIARLSPDGVRIYPTVVVRDTSLEKLWREGKYTPATPDEAARLGGKLLGIFEESNIPVIRLGLNPTDDLSSGEALCGAYHPALGEMARSERYLSLAQQQIEKAGIRGGALTVCVNVKRVSAMSGQKKKNKRYLAEKYGFESITVCGDAEVPDGEVRLIHHMK